MEDVPDEDPIEFITEGKLSRRGSITYISYDETALSGMPGCKTSLTITPSKLKLKRTGEAISGDTVMEFEKGKRHTTMYETPVGPIGMEILTEKISGFSPKDENTDVLSMEYAISLRGVAETRKLLEIEVRDKN